MKESLWLYILYFMVPSIASMYCLTELLVFTVALYMFFSWQFPSCGHVSLSLELHCLLECMILWMVSILLLWTFMIWDMLLVQLQLTFILFLLKILARELWLGKYLLIRFSKSLLKFDVMHHIYIYSQIVLHVEVKINWSNVCGHYIQSKNDCFLDIFFLNSCQ